MRFANSPEMSSCLKDGTSPVFDIETVGNASSSLTPGSSTTSVAGKNRFPTISCARASVVDATSIVASMAKGHQFLNMGNSGIADGEQRTLLRQAKTGGPRASFASTTPASCRTTSTGLRSLKVRNGSKRAMNVYRLTHGSKSKIQRHRKQPACGKYVRY